MSNPVKRKIKRYNFLINSLRKADELVNFIVIYSIILSWLFIFNNLFHYNQ
ncbi:hypothetical protein LDG_7005 [Legionella drancourtii LLAP12]|uniref:Uncharacterized protein n=1 Tax=Legionella drancourtii LLAP12 TaxID=658187 RepID=G9EP24_9GAMM|nr:hypothetical protein LDG_7005 [Legionella drancourtii LLAP12]